MGREQIIVRHRALFGVLVRMVGVLMVFNSGIAQLSLLILRVIYNEPRGFRYQSSIYWLQPVVIILVGGILIRWPEWVVRLGWPDTPRNSN
jgi:predicted Co/Zn/Cd cation transporter (cation efflux family)